MRNGSEFLKVYRNGSEVLEGWGSTRGRFFLLLVAVGVHALRDTALETGSHATPRKKLGVQNTLLLYFSLLFLRENVRTSFSYDDTRFLQLRIRTLAWPNRRLP